MKDFTVPAVDYSGQRRCQECGVPGDCCRRSKCLEVRSITNHTEKPESYYGLRSWVMSPEDSKTDPNLRYKQRYALDRMHSAKRYFRGSNNHYGGGVASPKRPRTADQILNQQKLPGWSDATARTDGFVSFPVTPAPCVEKVHVPNFVCFGKRKETWANARGENPPELPDDTPVWSEDLADWTAGHGLMHSIIAYNLVGRKRRVDWLLHYPDPTVSKAGIRLVEAQLAAKFKDDELKYYSNPDRLHGQVFTTIRSTEGGEADILARQKQKLASVKKRVKKSALLDAIHHVLNGSLTRGAAAASVKMSDGQFKTAMCRLLKTADVTEDQQWHLAVSKHKKQFKDGVYALAKLSRSAAQIYLIVPAKDFALNDGTNQRLSDDGLHNVICDIMTRQIRNGKIRKLSDLVPGSSVYRALYDEFTSRPWRFIIGGKLIPTESID